MTLFALGTLLPVVLVVLLVTGVAVYWRVLIAIVGVALLAGHPDVFATQRIAGLVMVKPHVRPVVLCMTVLAALSHSSFVFIVFFVTGITG